MWIMYTSWVLHWQFPEFGAADGSGTLSNPQLGGVMSALENSLSTTLLDDLLGLTYLLKKLNFGGKVVSDYHQIRMPHYTAVFAVTREQQIMVMRCYRHAVGKSP